MRQHLLTSLSKRSFDQPADAARFPADLIDRIERASAIFAGTVVASLPMLRQRDRRHVTVRVDAMISAPAELAPGRELVLAVDDLVPGDQAYFFVGPPPSHGDASHLAASLATLPEMHRTVHQVLRYLADEALYARLARATRVFIASWQGGAFVPRRILSGVRVPVSLHGEDEAIVILRADQLDVLPLDQLERVRRLIASPPVPPEL